MSSDSIESQPLPSHKLSSQRSLSFLVHGVHVGSMSDQQFRHLKSPSSVRLLTLLPARERLGRLTRRDVADCMQSAVAGKKEEGAGRSEEGAGSREGGDW